MPFGSDLRPAALRDALAAGQAALDRAVPGYDHVAETVQRRILAAFAAAGVNEGDLGQGTGYGYGDRAREACERVFAHALQAPAALVRPHLVSGTHAIAVALGACLSGGGDGGLLAATGRPYDTLLPVIAGGPLSLQANGVGYAEVDPWSSGHFEPHLAGAAAARHRPRAVLVQRARGYGGGRPALRRAELAALLSAVRAGVGHGAVLIVDNCYSEFVEPDEPTSYGADLICGSLIKNPGGGIAPAGGYIAGRSDLVELAAERLFAPGLGSAVGPSIIPGRQIMQGLFLAPAAVATALKVSTFAAGVFAQLGYAVEPQPGDERSDISQAIRLGSRDLVERFCRSIQAASPVDSCYRPEFAPMPGYDHQVIMAAGTFVQGASLELSADAPDRPPYWVYFQGGLGVGYGKAAIESAAAALLSAGEPDGGAAVRLSDLPVI